MIQARFHASLYTRDAVAEAMKAFTAHATLELLEQDEYWVVNIANADDRERLVRAELANFALGLTVEKRGAG